MDNMSICYASLLDNITRGGIQKLSHVNSGSKLVFLREKDGCVESEALLAVKLDPAVLEAQVTIENEMNDIKISEKPQKIKDPKENEDFEKAISLQRAALFSLSSQQFNLLMKYVDTIRQQRLLVQKKLECGFCKNNGHPEVWYTTHSLKDGKGRVKCPILRAFTCRRCGATGDRAHTFKYCPLNYF